MKRILFIIPLMISVLSFAQDFNGKRVNAKDELTPPFDTSKTKKGFAIINDTLYVGNGTYWKKTLLYIPIDQQPGDILQVDPTNTFITNGHASPATCNTTSNIGLSHVNALVWAYTSGFYNIACNQYTLATGGTITLDDFAGTAGQFRTDAIILRANQGVVILKGDNSDDQVGGTKTVDPATEILLSYVTINSDNQIVNVASTTVYYDNHAGVEWTHTNFGGATIAYNYGTVKLAPSDSSIHITLLPNNSGFRFTAPTVQTSGGKRLTGYIRHDATVNNNRNWVIRKMNGSTQVSGSAAITLTAQRGYNKTAAFNNQWQLFSIPLDGTEGFGGQDTYTGFEFRNTGTGGTVNQYFDSIRVESGITINNGGGGGITNIFVRNDSLYYTINGGNVFVGMLNGASNANINDFFAKPSQIVTNRHTFTGGSGIINGVTIITGTESDKHSLQAGTIPVAYYSTNQGRAYTRVALPLTGITGAASDDIRSEAFGIINGQAWAMGVAYRNANDNNGTRIALWKTSNGSTWSNPTLLTVIDTSIYKTATPFGNIRQNGSRIGVTFYAARTGGVSVVLFVYSDDGGTTWSSVEVATGDISSASDYKTEADWIGTSATEAIIMIRRELANPVLFYTTNNGTSWTSGGTLTIASAKAFSTQWHAPYLYKEGNEVFALWSDRNKQNIVQISVTGSYNSAASWNASTVRIVGNSITQTGWGAYDFGYQTTIGTGENRQLVYYDFSPTTVDQGDLDHINTDIIIKPLPLTPRPMFIGTVGNQVWVGGGNTGENANAFRFDRAHTLIDNLSMLGADSSTITVKETGLYFVGGEITTSSIAFASLAQVDMSVYNPSEDTTDLTHSYQLGGALGQGLPRITFHGVYPLFKNQIVKFRLNVDADETAVTPPIPIFYMYRLDDAGIMNGGNGTTVNQNIYDTTAADQVLRDTLNAHNIRLIAVENGGVGASGPDGMDGSALGDVGVNMLTHALNFNTSAGDNIGLQNGAAQISVNGVGTFSIDATDKMVLYDGSGTPTGIHYFANYYSGQKATGCARCLIDWGTAKGLIDSLAGTVSSGLTVGTTTVGSGTNTRVFYNNSGVLGEYTVTGTGTTVALSTSPVFSTKITSPFVLGGTGTTQTLTYQTTSGVGTSGADHIFLVGNNGGTEALRITNAAKLQIQGATANQALNTPGLWVSGGMDIGTNFADASVAMSIASGRTWLLNFYNSGAANKRMMLSSAGYLGVGDFTPGTANSIEFRPVANNKLVLVLKRLSGQSTAILDLQDESANSLSSFNENGAFSNKLAYVAKSGSYTAVISDAVIEVTATGQTITLPTSVGITGKVYTIKLSASGSGTVATTSSQTIDDSTTYSLASQYKYVTVQSNGANWIVIANN